MMMLQLLNVEQVDTLCREVPVQYYAPAPVHNKGPSECTNQSPVDKTIRR
jgi:hypothetical protein